MRDTERASSLVVHFFLLCLLNGFFFSMRAANRGTELKSFYVATHVVSDASPFRYEYILDVKAVDGGVEVRNIRIAPSASGCPGSLSVKAADRKIAGNTPQRIAGIRICSLNPDDVAQQ